MTSASSIRPGLTSRAARSIATALALLALAAPASAGDWTAARDAFEAGRYADAVAELEPLAALHPENPATQAFLGIARTQAGDAAGAVAALERAVTGSDRPDYRLALAWALILDGRPDRALDRLEETSEEVPARLARVRDRLLAIAAVASSDTRRATRLLEAMIDPGSGAPEPWIALAVFARRRGDLSEAAAALQRASELDPSRGDLAKAASAARMLTHGRLPDKRLEEALRQTVERVERQLAPPSPPERGRSFATGIAAYAPGGDEAADCAMPEDHRCIPGRLAREIADGGLSRSAAPPD